MGCTVNMSFGPFTPRLHSFQSDMVFPNCGSAAETWTPFLGEVTLMTVVGILLNHPILQFWGHCLGFLLITVGLQTGWCFVVVLASWLALALLE